MRTAEQVVSEIFALYQRHGDEDYIGEPVSQLEHMSQAAQLALDSRGHAAMERIRLTAPQEQSWREGKLPEALSKARAHPQWSSLNPGAKVNQVERQAQIDSLVLEL